MQPTALALEALQAEHPLVESMWYPKAQLRAVEASEQVSQLGSIVVHKVQVPALL